MITKNWEFIKAFILFIATLFTLWGVTFVFMVIVEGIRRAG